MGFIAFWRPMLSAVQQRNHLSLVPEASSQHSMVDVSIQDASRLERTKLELKANPRGIFMSCHKIKFYVESHCILLLKELVVGEPVSHSHMFSSLFTFVPLTLIISTEKCLLLLLLFYLLTKHQNNSCSWAEQELEDFWFSSLVIALIISCMVLDSGALLLNCTPFHWKSAFEVWLL